MRDSFLLGWVDSRTYFSLISVLPAHQWYTVRTVGKNSNQRFILVLLYLHIVGNRRKTHCFQYYVHEHHSQLEGNLYRTRS